MSYQDKTLTCADCGQPFTFSGEDQAYYAQKGYTNEPKRCPNCRQSRRSTRSFGGGGGGYGQSSREMYPAVCAQCGKATEVPFQPRGDRPVYCSDCYRRMPSRSSSSNRRY
ncbi:MAG: zinc-ribbon domain containing protein [Chloroflexi bacterium]|nr:zinc-ribbon domain containing protein [Chloroflexota bacterium]